MPTKREPRQKVTFALLAPEAQQVSLLGDFSGWEQQPVSMKKLKDGRWQATLALAEGKYEYRYLVDGRGATTLTARRALPTRSVRKTACASFPEASLGKPGRELARRRRGERPAGAYALQQHGMGIIESAVERVRCEVAEVFLVQFPQRTDQ